MKILLIFPPIAPPISPYLSTPLLAGQLIANGYDAESLDLSVEFFNYILTPEYIKKSYEEAKRRYSFVKNVEIDFKDKATNFKKLSYSEQINQIRKFVYDKTFPSEEHVLKTAENIKDALNIYHDIDRFYDIKERKKQAKIINDALTVASLPYAPARCNIEKYENKNFLYNFEDIKYQVEDRENNIFVDYFVNKIKEHDLKSYDVIFVSFPNLPQMVPAYTLCGLLKEHTNAKIVIGGNIINRIDNELKNEKEAFSKFYDYILCGCGEKSIVKLIKCFEGKEKLKNVNGLIYKTASGKIKYNQTDYDYEINNSSPVSLKGIRLENYFTPEIIFPIQVTKGCYWGKCLFCGLHYPKKKYSVKSVINAVDEIEFLNKEYNIENFEFVDEALKPEFLSELADEILKRKLNIKYYLCSRIENGYTKELCEKLYKSGLKLIEVGFESGCERIYKKLNKGIDFKKRNEILKALTQSGIWTYLYAIVGYPDETKEEAIKTINFKNENPECADSMFVHKFWLDKKAPITKKYLFNGILRKKENKANKYVQTLDFDAFNMVEKKELNYLIEKVRDENLRLGDMVFETDEYFFLFVGHYGKSIKTRFSE